MPGLPWMTSTTGQQDILPLHRLQPGQCGTVVSVAGGRGMQYRLISMGLSVGSRLRVLRSAGKGHGPVLVATGQTRLALGRGMSHHILVRAESQETP